jgi:hypothetical protein
MPLKAGPRAQTALLLFHAVPETALVSERRHELDDPGFCMPGYELQKLDDADLKATFAYLRTVARSGIASATRIRRRGAPNAAACTDWAN